MDYVMMHCIGCGAQQKLALETFLEYERKHPEVEPYYTCVKCQQWLQTQDQKLLAPPK